MPMDVTPHGDGEYEPATLSGRRESCVHAEREFFNPGVTVQLPVEPAHARPQARQDARSAIKLAKRVHLAFVIAVAVTACKDSHGPDRQACAIAMAEVRETWGEPYQQTTTWFDGTMSTVWHFHDGPNTRQYRFRWGEGVDGCEVQDSVISLDRRSARSMAGKPRSSETFVDV